MLIGFLFIWILLVVSISVFWWALCEGSKRQGIDDCDDGFGVCLFGGHDKHYEYEPTRTIYVCKRCRKIFEEDGPATFEIPNEAENYKL